MPELRSTNPHRFFSVHARLSLACLTLFSLVVSVLLLPASMSPFLRTADAAAAELFISEYIEGSSNN